MILIFKAFWDRNMSCTAAEPTFNTLYITDNSYENRPSGYFKRNQFDTFFIYPLNQYDLENV